MQDSEIKGVTTELLCQAELIKRNINISVPVSPYCKYDFIADIYGKLYKIQVKYSNINTVGIVITTKSTHLSAVGAKINKYTKDDIDFFCTIYDGNCYLIPIHGIENRAQVTLVLEPEKCNQIQNMMIASDYLLDNQLMLIKNNKEIVPQNYIIQKYDKDGNIVGEFKTEYECAISCGDIKKQPHIHNCITGKRKSAYGFTWKKIYQG